MTKFSTHFAALIAIIAGVSSFALPAQAILELRGGYVSDQVDASDINSKFSANPSLKTMTGFNADAILSLPLMPIGFGVRYEQLEDKESNSAASFDATLKRVSLILNKRFIDTFGYLGVIGTIGVSNDFQYKFTYAGATTTTKATGLSGTLGVEGGVKLGFFLLGAEVGYLYAPLSKLQENGQDYTTGGHTVSAKLDGVYARGSVGFSF